MKVNNLDLGTALVTMSSIIIVLVNTVLQINEFGTDYCILFFILSTPISLYVVKCPLGNSSTCDTARY